MSLKTGLVIFGLVIGTTVMAQERERGDGKTPQERAQSRTEWMAKELSLTEAQKTKVAALNLQAVEKNQQIRSNASLSADQKKAAWKENHKAQRAQLREILTADQQALLKSKKEAMHSKAKARHAEHGSKTPQQRAQFRTDHMTKELGLTEDQRTKVNALNLSAIEKNDAVRKDESLSKEQKEARFKANREEHKAGLKNILTADQLKTLQARKKDCHGKHRDKKDAKPKK